MLVFIVSSMLFFDPAVKSHYQNHPRILELEAALRPQQDDKCPNFEGFWEGECQYEFNGTPDAGVMYLPITQDSCTHIELMNSSAFSRETESRIRSSTSHRERADTTLRWTGENGVKLTQDVSTYVFPGVLIAEGKTEIQLTLRDDGKLLYSGEGRTVWKNDHEQAEIVSKASCLLQNRASRSR